jgi:hypothetical protein
MKNFVFILSLLFAHQAQAQIFLDTKPKSEQKTETQTTPEKEVKSEPQKTESKVVSETSKPAATEPKSVSSSNNAPALSDTPPNAEPGKCYAKSTVPDKYETVTEQIVDQPLTVKKVKIPATYKTVADTLVSQPKTTKKVKVPEVYETIYEDVMVSPATTKWVKGKADVACLSPNPKDCEVLVLVEMPPVYKKVEKKVLKQEAVITDVVLPMEYKVIAKKVVETEEKIVDEVTPATFKTVQKKVLIEKGGYAVWREVICTDDLTKEKVLQIQKSLKDKGYNPGPVDGILGNGTKTALLQFQRDKHLPEGNLTLETLNALGVN